jgi:hypothetical protein
MYSQKNTMTNLFEDEIGKLKTQVSELMSAGQMSEPDAKKLLFSQSMADATARNSTPEDLYNSFPQIVKDYFEYTPEDLK